MSNDLVVIDNKLMEFGYSEETLAELSQEEKQDLIEALNIDMQEALEGVNLKPAKLKINKDIQQFADPFGEVLKEINGVLVHNHKTRGHWPKGSGKVPECSSKDAITGTVSETGEKRKCAGCPYDQWRSTETDAGEKRKSKACKEMRRLFIDLKDYALPLMLSLPPTSIGEFDDYINARVTKGIPLLLKEMVIKLNKEESHGYTYAVAEFNIGDLIDPKRAANVAKQRKSIKAFAAQEEITQDDYINDDDDGNINLDSISTEDLA
ncbi:MAG: hypothetical protein MI740_10310 [Halanaerobiales bacterium]|nr:hypothetical protein [Halanaerobiales bacterium]